MKDMIYCQRDIPKEKWRYGLRSSAAVGCGWIATYNALRLMGYRAKPEDLIRYFERQLLLIHGTAGTSSWGPAVCFRQWGFPVEVSRKRKDFDELVKRSDACILFYRWRRGWMLGAHFVALHEVDGKVIGYNTYTNSKGPDYYGPSLDEFLKEKKYYGAVLTAIRKK